MADDVQKQNLVSDDSCLNTTGESQIDSKLTNIDANDYIYSESVTTVNDNGHDILQQALKEAETVTETESVSLESSHEENKHEVESEAQNLLNTLTGENVVHESDSVKDSDNTESLSNIETTENCVNNVSQENDETDFNENEKQTVSVNQSIVTNAKPPLGSSQNPIKIVLEGSKFHPSQNLTAEQFQQITQFIQGQQIDKIRENGGSTVVYNPTTNTKIIYKVVSPQEALAKTSLLTHQSGVSLLQNSGSPASSNSTAVATPAKRGRGRPRKDGSAPVSSGRGRGRGRKSTCKSEEMDVGKELPALSKEELENRKKHRPRTRSGRISKPPSYMVKEYKRIHPLDYHNNEDDIADKPDGGYSDYEVSDSDEEKSNISSNAANDEGKEENEESAKLTADVKEKEPVKKIVKHRGRPPLSEAERSSKRKNKLRDAMVGCSDTEIQEVVLDRLVKTLPVWDFMLKKCSEDSHVNVYEVYHSFDSISSHMKKHYISHLQAITSATKVDQAFIEITDSNIGAMLGASTGKFTLSNQIKFQDLRTSSKKRSGEEIRNEDPDPKRLKLNWSGRYSASGVDLSISEVSDDAHEKKPEEIKSFHNNVSIIKPDQMQVSIAPVQNENQETADKIEDIEVKDEVIKVTGENDITFIAEIEDSETSALTNNVNASEGQSSSDQICTLEQSINNTTTVSETHQITAIPTQETASDIQLEEEVAVQESIQQNASEVIQHTVTTEGADGGEPVTLLINPEAANEQISNNQAVVSVIDEANGVNEATAVSTENLLGLLGEQLSPDALQPGNIVIIQNSDGTTTTVALSSSEDKEIPIETVQALLAMDPSTHQQIQ